MFREGNLAQFRRREFLIGASALLAAPFAVEAEQRGKLKTIGQLNEWGQPVSDSVIAKQVRRLMFERYKSLGWTVGRDLAIHPLYAEYDAARLPWLAKQLVDEGVDVISVTTTAPAVAAIHATGKIPIVLAGACAYPVECGVIKSFARPGGNVTGVAFFQGIEVQSKVAEFARELLPSARRLAWLTFPPDLVNVSGGEFSPKPYYLKVTRGFGFELGYYECSKVADFDSVFAEMRVWGAEAVIVEPAALSSVGPAQRIAQLARQSRLPSFFNTGYNVQIGGLLSYGPAFADMYGQTATYVDRVLRGARPADLPVEMPNKLELVVNVKTAKALGISIPDSILVQADRVIQ